MIDMRSKLLARCLDSTNQSDTSLYKQWMYLRVYYFTSQRAPILGR